MDGRDAVTGRFLAGHRTWSAGTRGVIRPNRGSFTAGRASPNTLPVGTVRFNRSGGRSGRREPFIKVAEPCPYTGRPGHMRPQRLVNWEAAHGPAPPGCVVMRILPYVFDNTLENLLCTTRAVLGSLNRGNWHPRRERWADLPADRELRLQAAAIAALKAGPPVVFLVGAW